MQRDKCNFVIGVDEAGRGPLAGPVTAAAVLAPVDFEAPNDLSTNLRDSKKYTPNHRKEWFRYIDEHPTLKYEVSAVFPGRIDRINIYNAASLAASRAVTRLIERYKLQKAQCKVNADGSLKLDSTNLEYDSIPGGDQKIPEIQLASIVAKVKRDRTMKRYNREFPEYNFASHKGYGTEEHRKLLQKHGPCRIHRSSFSGVSNN